MKKFIIRSIYFLIFFGVFFVLINAIYLGIITSTDFDFKNRLESLKFENTDFDLLVLGASTSLDAFDTELLSSRGIPSYNLAIGGATLRTNMIQLEEYLTQCSKYPKYVVLGLNSPMVEDFDDDEIHPIVDVTMADHKYTINDVPILRFKWLGFEFLKKLVSKNHRKAKLVGGQLKFQKTIPDHSSYGDQVLDLDKIKSSLWIRNLVSYCNQKKIEILIIEMPGYRATQNPADLGPYEIEYSNGVRAELYNFNSRELCKIFDAERDWIGNSHLNEFGAAKFTQELFEVLVSDHQK